MQLRRVDPGAHGHGRGGRVSRGSSSGPRMRFGRWAGAETGTVRRMNGDDRPSTGQEAQSHPGGGPGSEMSFERVYDELRRIAESLMRQERPGQTIQATALVHDAFIRLADADGQRWLSSRHFLNTAVLVMRRVLIDRARVRARVKHGGGRARVALDLVEVPATEHFALDEMERVSEAVERLGAHNQRWADVLGFRIFLGLSVEQTSEALGVSAATVKSDSRFAMLWLRSTLAGLDSGG